MNDDLTRMQAVAEAAKTLSYVKQAFQTYVIFWDEDYALAKVAEAKARYKVAYQRYTNPHNSQKTVS